MNIGPFNIKFGAFQIWSKSYGIYIVKFDPIAILIGWTLSKGHTIY